VDVDGYVVWDVAEKYFEEGGGEAASLCDSCFDCEGGWCGRFPSDVEGSFA